MRHQAPMRGHNNVTTQANTLWGHAKGTKGHLFHKSELQSQRTTQQVGQYKSIRRCRSARDSRRYSQVNRSHLQGEEDCNITIASPYATTFLQDEASCTDAAQRSTLNYHNILFPLLPHRIMYSLQQLLVTCKDQIRALETGNSSSARKPLFSALVVHLQLRPDAFYANPSAVAPCKHPVPIHMIVGRATSFPNPWDCP